MIKYLMTMWKIKYWEIVESTAPFPLGKEKEDGAKMFIKSIKHRSFSEGEGVRRMRHEI